MGCQHLMRWRHAESGVGAPEEARARVGRRPQQQSSQRQAPGEPGEDSEKKTAATVAGARDAAERRKRNPMAVRKCSNDGDGRAGSRSSDDDRIRQQILGWRRGYRLARLTRHGRSRSENRGRAGGNSAHRGGADQRTRGGGRGPRPQRGPPLKAGRLLHWPPQPRRVAGTAGSTERAQDGYRPTRLVSAAAAARRQKVVRSSRMSVPVAAAGGDGGGGESRCGSRRDRRPRRRRVRWEPPPRCERV